MKKIFLSCCVILFSAASKGQNLTKVDLSEHGVLTDWMPVSTFPAKDKIVYLNQDSFKLSIPEKYLNENSKIGILFYGGYNFNKTTRMGVPNWVAFLWEHDKNKDYIVIDRDNNKDLSNDKPELLTDTLFMQDQLTHFRKLVFLFRPISHESDEIINKLTNTFKKNPAYSHYLPVNNWLEVRGINYVSGRLILGEDSVQIGLIDGNNNGVYNDIQWDRAFATDYFSQEKSDQQLNSIMINKKTNLEIGSNFYFLTDIDPPGNYIVIKQYVEGTHIYKPGDILPDIILSDLAGGESNISLMVKKKGFTILYFWGSWCNGCIAKIPDLKSLVSKYSNLQIIGIDSFDRIENARKTISKYAILWKNFQGDKGIYQLLNINQFPTYVLVDQSGRIVNEDVNLQNLEAQIR